MFPIFFSMIITNTRGPIIALLFTLIVFLFLMKDIKFTTKLLFISFISIISIGLVLVLPENLTNRFELLFHLEHIEQSEFHP